jgi:hypothetical protein
MADENVDLRFIAAQLGRVLDGQHELEAGQHGTNERLGKLEAAVSEMRIALAATRVDVGAIKADVEAVRETQQNQGARLNVIDGRLAIIEKHAGLVKA